MKPVLSLSLSLSLSLTLMLCSVATAQTPEFPVVGDWANKSWGTTNWGGQIPSSGMWADIDSLYFNWLKVNLEIGNTATEAILDHGTYSFIVDRASGYPWPYEKCQVQYTGDDKPRRAWSNFLARYVMGSFLFRFHPETGFDLVTRNGTYGQLVNEGGATDSDFLQNGEEYNAIKSTFGLQSHGIVAEYPTANASSSDPLVKASLRYVEYVTIRAKIEDPPSRKRWMCALPC